VIRRTRKLNIAPCSCYKKTRKLVSPRVTRNIPVVPNTFGRIRPAISMILIACLRYPSGRVSRPSGSGSAKKRLKFLLRYSASRNNKSFLTRESKK
jgi:hypothetical protein